MQTHGSERIFDGRARRLQRSRSDLTLLGEVEQHIAEMVEDRLAGVSRALTDILVVNTGTGLLADRLRDGGASVTETDFAPRLAALRSATCCDEDALPFPPSSFDAVIAPWGYDSVDDLPGALILARRSLRPDGLFLGVILGSPTLPVLRSAIAEADGDIGVARLHPQIDVRAAGDLLVRAGYALPVADTEQLTLTYRYVGRLIDDLRGIGASNTLRERSAVTRAWVAKLEHAFARRAVAGERVAETVTLIVLTAWAPGEGQPKPARRGSATTSLSAALNAPRPAP